MKVWDRLTTEEQGWITDNRSTPEDANEDARMTADFLWLRYAGSGRTLGEAKAMYRRVTEES